MAKYGTFCYGNGTLYGTGDAQPCNNYTGRYIWVLEIDWDGDGAFDGTNEADGRLIAPVSWRRGRESFVNRQGSGLEAIYPGELTLTLDNHDGRYDPYDASGVLYGRVPQGMAMRLVVYTVVAGVAGTRYPVFTGFVSDIQPVSGREEVTVTCVDEIETLQNQDISLPLMLSTYTGTAIRAILDQVGITGYSVPDGSVPQTLVSINNANAMQEINEMVSAALSVLFVDREGHIRYYDVTTDALAQDHTITEDKVLKVFSISQPWENRRTHIKVAANRWVRTAIKILWQTTQDIALTAGQTKTFEVEFSGICEAIQLDPYAGDYSLVGLGYLGSGSTWIAASISNIKPSGCTVTMTNNGPFPTSTYIKIRGREYVQSYPAASRGYVPWQTYVPVPSRTRSTKTVYTAGDDSIPARKRSYYTLDSRYMQDGNYAAAFADLLKTHLENGHKNPVITLQTGDNALMWGIELFDNVHFTSATKGIDNDYVLGQVEGQWRDSNGQDVEITYRLIDRLTSNTYITPEGITEIPEETEDPDTTPGGTPSDPGRDDECDLYNAVANGPYDLGQGGQIYYAYGETARTVTASYPCNARGSLTHTNPTRVKLTYTVEYTTNQGATWNPSNISIPMTAQLMSGETVVASQSMYNGSAVFAFAGMKPITGVSVNVGGSGTDGRMVLLYSFDAQGRTDYGKLRLSSIDELDTIAVTIANGICNVVISEETVNNTRDGGIIIPGRGEFIVRTGDTIAVLGRKNSQTVKPPGPGSNPYLWAQINVNGGTALASGEYFEPGPDWHLATYAVTAGNDGAMVDEFLAYAEVPAQSAVNMDIDYVRLSITGNYRIKVTAFSIANVCPL